MHLLLTDRMACPRCGPEFGLILLADRMVARRVIQGSLGCPNCRDRFPVVEGVADLRPPPREPDAVTRAEGAGGEEGDQGAPPVSDPLGPPELAALLGIPGGPGNVLLLGAAARHAPALGDMVEGIEWVAALGGAPSPASHAEAAGPGSVEAPFPGVSRIHVRGRLPLYSRSMRGVVLGEDSPVPIEEAARVLAPLGRVVILAPAPRAGEGLLEAGLEVLLEDPRVLVGTRKS